MRAALTSIVLFLCAVVVSKVKRLMTNNNAKVKTGFINLGTLIGQMYKLDDHAGIFIRNNLVQVKVPGSGCFIQQLYAR